MSRSLGTNLDDTITLTPVSEIDAADEVRHFDQLSPRAKRAVIAADEGQSTSVHAPSLSSVDVVVFTDYYRVE
jgi:hypothetical protein